MTKVIPLKTWPEPFQAIRAGTKRFEFRQTRDRDFQVGDILHLREWNPDGEFYTGQRLYVRVTYLLDFPAFGIPEGYCIMSLDSPVCFG